jgi:hypothetical protein
MRNQKGYVAGYNGQLVVTCQQVIVGAMLSQHPVDRTLLHPLLDQCRDQLAAAGIRPKLRTVLADSGYVSDENFARADADGLRLLAPLAKDTGRRYLRPPNGPGTWTGFRPLPGPGGACSIPPGRDDYRMRARTVEPVFGQLKTCQKLTMMSRRGLAACENECCSPAPRTTCASCTGTARKANRQRPTPGSQHSRSPKTTVSPTVSAFQIAVCLANTALCDRLNHAASDAGPERTDLPL